MSKQQQNQTTIIRDLLRVVQNLGRQQAQAGPHGANANNISSIVNATGHWWKSASHTRTEAQQRALTWTQFKDEVMGKYFSQALRDEKETEFLQLKQGKMKLKDYQRKFEQLSRYTPRLMDTKAKKARRFELGLRTEIGGILASHQFTTYS
ncbi:uncharacterized protein LOC111380780 [Olea europaea var. sylvestris]|uniref:uncharacterized protein LOC111380780 n=1 Tax=Olea europaea var. sylvestris TaxID=158386 RepID=UPI000C1D45C8|nr:uncharacterized protein LOC111380780 [Olea europaea var. sylvestris]